VVVSLVHTNLGSSYVIPQVLHYPLQVLASTATRFGINPRALHRCSGMVGIRTPVHWFPKQANLLISDLFRRLSNEIC